MPRNQENQCILEIRLLDCWHRLWAGNNVVNSLEKKVMLFCTRWKHTCDGELSANLTESLLEGNKVFSSLCPKIEEGETMLLQAFAKTIRETNRNHSQCQSSSFSSPKCCLSYPSADPEHPIFPLQGREKLQYNLICILK